MNLRPFRRHASWSELASAYADGSLNAPEVTRFEAHLAGCAGCQVQVDGQRALRTALQALPEEIPGRSFRLTRDMVAPAAAPPGAEKRRTRATNTTLAWGARVTAAAAAVALVAVIMVDLGGSSGGDGDEDSPVAASGDAGAAAPVQEATLMAGTEEARDTTTDSTATATAPSAPAYEGGDVEGASAGEGEGDGGGEPDDAGAGETGEGEAQPDATEPPADVMEDTLYSSTAPLTENSSLAASQEAEGDSDGWSLLGVEIALAVVLAVAVAAMFLLPRLRRR